MNNEIVIDDAWFTVSQIDAETFAISEFGHWEKVHSFLLLGQERAALIDTGLGIDQIKRMTDQLTDLPIIVLTTHVHADHIGSHGQFEEIYVHEAEEDWLVSGIKGLGIEQIRKDMSRDITRPVPETFDPTSYKPYQGKPTGLLRDGDVVELGGRSLKIYHTPGHSPGHIALFDPSRGYLFTGDLLYDETPVYAFYPTTDPEALLNSLDTISRIPEVKRIFGSHNTIGLDPSWLKVAQHAAQDLREKDLVRYGTGIHTYEGLRIQF
ncbi:MBL fold metallo-hydrolase [Paenibacillus faecalis]|uniref:MBL fold metallo-hydrolase n=1 Tax=Paenibacillus faecalis TaxID=2079532 RepID=UPI000D10D01B|nr:MBL fold metallo-hydrolase [Paenibacillus faecalis]